MVPVGFLVAIRLSALLSVLLSADSQMVRAKIYTTASSSMRGAAENLPGLLVNTKFNV